MVEGTAVKPGRSFWVIGIVALVWNLLGVLSYLISVTMSEEVLAQMAEAERALITDTPAWVTGAYAIAVFSGFLACIVLLMRKGWSIPLFAISLIAILAQMTHALLMSRLIEVRGPSGAILPVSVALIALFLVWYARKSKQRGWIG